MSEQSQATPLSFVLLGVVLFFCFFRITCSTSVIPYCIELRSPCRSFLGCCGCKFPKQDPCEERTVVTATKVRSTDKRPLIPGQPREVVRPPDTPGDATMRV